MLLSADTINIFH